MPIYFVTSGHFVGETEAGEEGYGKSGMSRSRLLTESNRALHSLDCVSGNCFRIVVASLIMSHKFLLII
jgi:hypothetical protein